jgi:hypothetical protein
MDEVALTPFTLPLWDHFDPNVDLSRGLPVCLWALVYSFPYFQVPQVLCLIVDGNHL